MLSKNTFIELLKSKTPPDLKKAESLNLVIDFVKCLGKDEFEQSELRNAISYLDRIEASISDKEEGKLELSFENIITSAFLLDKISPWVKKVRKKIFGSTAVPFNWEDAIEWIKKESGKTRKSSNEETKKLKKDIERIQKDYGFEVNYKIPFLPYKKKYDKFIYRAGITGNPKLSFLEYESKLMEKATGFLQHSLVLLILAGIEPLISGIKISKNIRSSKLSENENLIKSEIILSIIRKDLPFKELQKIYNEIRASLRVVKEKPLKEKHLRVMMFINEVGNPPKSGQPGYWKYWKSAQINWNIRYPQEKYTSWQGIRNSYERMISGLENKFIIKKISS